MHKYGQHYASGKGKFTRNDGNIETSSNPTEVKDLDTIISKERKQSANSMANAQTNNQNKQNISSYSSGFAGYQTNENAQLF